MPRPVLLDRRLLLLTGKGGTGKSTISAALALLASRRGKRVLVCELDAQERIAPLLGSRPSGSTPREVLPGLFTSSVTPRDAMREYGTTVLRFKGLYEAVFENRVVQPFLRAIPSLSELVVLGKILHEVRAAERGRPKWDLVVVDAPATGHAVPLLRVPSVLLDTVPAGPLRNDARWMQDILLDPGMTGLSIVTLPEEMPVSEAIELDGVVRKTLRIPRNLLVINSMPEERFSASERARIAELRRASAPIGPAAEAAWFQALRAENAALLAARARTAIGLPTAFVPLLARERWDREAIEYVAAALERGGALAIGD